MRKICFLLFFLILPFLVYAQNIPQPSGWVNDFAGVISPEYKDKLNALIEELEQKTTTEIAVVTVDSISPYGEIEYARLLFDNWKPGKKGKDNGVLVLLAVKERRWRIETGYGVEGILPDGLCGEIGRNYMVPYFKDGKYGEGLYQGVTKISGIILGEINPTLIPQSQSIPAEPIERVRPLAIILILLATLIIIFSQKVLFLLLFIVALLLLLIIFKIYFLIALILAFLYCIIYIVTESISGRGSGGGFGGGGFGGGGFGGFGGGGGGGGGAGGGF